MASKKPGNLLECRRIVPDVAALGEPPPQRDRFGFRCNDDGDSHLAGELSVRSIEGDGADWIATKAQFALFIQPLPWSPTQLYIDFSLLYEATSRSWCCRIMHPPSLVTHRLPPTAS
jgi:hypothetical protein